MVTNDILKSMKKKTIVPDSNSVVGALADQPDILADKDVADPAFLESINLK